MLKLLKDEPVLASVTGLVTAAIALLVAFGVHLTDVQTGAIVLFVGAALGVAAKVRSAVSPIVASVPEN